jgi:DNA-3-methyladenine glycosylase
MNKTRIQENSSPWSVHSRMQRKILTSTFFNRSTLLVARELLGKYLVVRRGRKQVAEMIVETEAYDGMKDKACHAHRGKTARNAVMFGDAGTIYVYFTYGMHWMLNIVTGPREYPAAVLIRGTDATTGPARVTKRFGINKTFNDKKAAYASGLWFEDRGVRVLPKAVKRTSRIGIHSAGPVWSKKPYRFVLVHHKKANDT